MQIQSCCTHCGKKYLAGTGLIGRRIVCQDCQEEFVVKEILDTELGPQAVHHQEIDPLAIPAQSQDASSIMPSIDMMHDSTVPQAASQLGGSWKQKIKHHDRGVPFGAAQRALLYLGAFLILIGIMLSLLPLMGTQFSRFQGSGNLGQVVGLIMGLAGAGLLATSLRRFKMASIAGGIGSACFVFIVFLASILTPTDDGFSGNSNLTPGPRQPESVASPWIAMFPYWEGFEDETPGPSVADRWTRYEFNNRAFAASFPKKPESRQARITVDRQVVSQGIFESRKDEFQFSLSLFQYPNPRKTADQILNEVELIVGQDARWKPIVAKGLTGRELVTNGVPKSTHARIVLWDRMVVQLVVNGPPNFVPGPISRRFLNSFRLTDGSAVNPKTETLEFELTRQQRQQDIDILTRARELESLMDEHIDMRARVRFPGHYLSEAAGVSEGSRKFYCHPDKLPIIGFELMAVDTSLGTIVHTMVPVYDESEPTSTETARPGYAVGEIVVNAQDYVQGVRLTFMRVTPKGFDTDDAYMSPWYGTPTSSGKGVRVGDGRPVYGIWQCRSRVINGLGVIQERE